MSRQLAPSWGRRGPRGSTGINRGEGAGDNVNQQPGIESHRESRPTQGDAGRGGRAATVQPEQSQHAHTDPSVHVAGGQLDPMLQQLFELLVSAAGRQARGSQRVGSYTVSDFLKLVRAMKDLGTTKFQGEPDPIKADGWIEMLESNFDATLCPMEYRKTIAAYYLEQEASAWWKSTERQFGDVEVTWDQFKSEFLQKYFPSEARDRLERKFLNLYQGNWSVRQYEAEFVKLRRYVYMGKEDEATMMRYFLHGLRTELSVPLSIADFPNLNRMIERAVNVEEKLNMMKTYSGRSGGAGGGQTGRSKTDHPRPPSVSRFSGKGSTRTGNQSRPGQKSSAPGACFKCGQLGHFARNCTGAAPEPKKHERPVPDHITCFTCGEKGHYASSCPNRTNPSIVSANRPRTEVSKYEPPSKKKAVENRVFALNVDEPGSSNPDKGPVAGM